MKAKMHRGWKILILLLVLAAIGIGIWLYVAGSAVPLDEYLTRINQYTGSSDYQQALELCNTALEQYPESGELYSKKAQIYQLQGNSDKAVGTLDYGYKVTGDAQLMEEKENYHTTQEEDVVFSPAQVGSSQTESQQQVLQDYQPYELPQVSLPQIHREQLSQQMEDNEQTVSQSQAGGVVQPAQ